MKGPGKPYPRRRAALIVATISACVALALAIIRARVSDGGRAGAGAPARASTGRGATSVAQTNVARPQSPRRSPALPNRVLSGVVVSGDGSPVQGAEVCAVELVEPCCSSRQCAFSDSGGQFTLHADAGARLLLASAKEHTPWRGRLGPITGAGSTAPIVITLEAGGAELSGMVLDASGGPVIGALVTVRPAAAAARAPVPDEADDDGRSDGFDGATLSDSSGAFRLRVPVVPLVLSAQAEAYSHGSSRVSPPFEPVTMVLVAGSEIVGNVRRADTREPVGNATVLAVSKSGLRERAHAEAGVDGQFSLRGLAAGTYELSAAGSKVGSLPVLVSVGVGERSEPVSLWVESTFTLAGTVAVDDEPCRRGMLVASGPSSGSTLIVDGEVASTGLLGGHYDVTIDCEGAIPIEESLDLREDQVGRRWTSSSGISLRGRVESASGQGLPGASVGVHPLGSTGRGSHCISDAAGEFSCAGLLPGDYRCSLNDAHGNEAAALDVSVSAASAPRVVLRAKPTGAIRGRLDPGEGSSVRIYALQEGGSIVETQVEAGRFQFDGMPLGRYVVSAGRPQRQRDGDNALASLQRDGQVVDVQLRAPRWATIRGRVVDERGAPLMDVWVHAALPLELDGDPRDGSVPVLTDESGNFTLERLVSGEYDLVASTGSGETTVRGIQSDAANVVIELSAYGALSGMVSNAAGEPVRSFELWYERGTKQSRDRYHTEDGSWDLPRLPPGEYRVGVHSEFGDAVTEVVVEPGGNATVALTVAPPG